MLPIIFVGSLCKIHALLFSRIAYVRTWKFVCFQKIFRVLLHNPRDVTRGERGNSFLAQNHRGGSKSPNIVTSSFFQNSTFASERPQIWTWERQTFILPHHASSNFLTLSAQCTSRLSSQNGELVYKNTCPSVENYQSQNV